MAFAQGSFLLGKPRTAFKLKETDKGSDKVFRGTYDYAKSRGLLGLSGSWGSPEWRPSIFLIQKDQMYTPQVRKFVLALDKHKAKIMQIYKLRNDTYNKLAAMAFAIFGVETKFGENWKYKLKEGSIVLPTTYGMFKLEGSNQWLLSQAKLAKKTVTGSGSTTNSRGLTQIKNIPDDIKEYYPTITPETLVHPEYAAVATVGFLAETLRMIRSFKNAQERNGIEPGDVNLAYITDENIFDYIPYVYSGRMAKIFKGNKGKDGATVTDNLYILEMKEHMRWFYIMERPLIN